MQVCPECERVYDETEYARCPFCYEFEEDDNNDAFDPVYLSEEEERRSEKQDDSYHFSIPFEYIEKNYGNDEYDIAVADMEIDVVWDDSLVGYTISYYVPDEDKIDPSQGNSIEEIYEYEVYEKLLDELEAVGISSLLA